MDARFSILTFPQRFDGTRLHLRVLVVPRLGAAWNGDPLGDTPFGLPGALAAGPPFADADLRLEARVLDGLGRFPARGLVDAVAPLPKASGPAPDARALLAAITAPGPGRFRVSSDPPALAPAAEPGVAIRKYLPHTYRSAFLFTGPRTPGAVTDDSYHCAIRAAVVPDPAFVTSPDTVSWGEVYAFCLRQPALAERLGLVRVASFVVPAGRLAAGGYVHVDVADDSAYADQAAADYTALARYAARVPRLTEGVERPLFAAVLFPVLNAPAVPAPLGDYAAAQADAAAYDAGFARVVHAQQPPAQSLLAEAPDGFPPTTDIGVRLAWDDEQVLAWMNRQLSVDPTVPPVGGAGQRLDAPMGVLGYHVDVRRAEPGQPRGPWRSLARVRSRAPLAVDDIALDGAPFDGELPVEVHPVRLDGRSTQYWLPPYFAQWNGTSLVLPDADAARVYRTTDPARPAPATLGDVYVPMGLEDVPLRYGRRYEFRVRLADVSGGGPAPGDPTPADAEAPVAAVHFVRHAVPEQPRIAELPRFGATPVEERYFADDVLRVPRPLLGYPGAVFTGKYADPVGDLAAASRAPGLVDSSGVPDPDVRRVRIDVEVRTLRFDNAGSVSGDESFLPLYTTHRDYPDDVRAPCEIPLEFRDAHVLRFGDPGDLGDLGVTPAELDGLAQLVLPRARELRLTVRAVADGDAAYWAPGAHEGRPVRLLVRRDSTDETGLLGVTATSRTVRALYLSPDPLVPWDQSVDQLLLRRTTGDTPAAIARLAEQVGCECKGLTLVGRPGERVVFGCARGLRHTLAPDNSSITFAAKDDLIHHWIVAITVRLARDWTWDSLRTVAVEIARARADGYQTDPSGAPAAGLDEETEPRRVVGDWEIHASVAMQALRDPQRDHTTLIFLDAVAPFPPGVADPAALPREIALTYDLTPRFRQLPAPASDPGPVPLPLRLPVTTAPAQVPRIVAAGLALSPFARGERYASTEPRRRKLWVELEEPVRDPRDAYFIRLLGTAPDPLLSDDRIETFAPPEEPALGIDVAATVVVGPGQADDRAGLAQMTPLEGGLDAAGGTVGRFFLVPLSPGLDESSRELFGFFTYELRVGHATVWSTPEARYGRPLPCTGVQHPAPTLFCTVRRDADRLVVEAPYAQAVFDGRDVTADPPRTSLWALLYAQVRQADGKDWRNVLLDDRVLAPAPRERRTRRDVAAAVRSAGAPVLDALLAGGAVVGAGVSAAAVRQSRAFANRDAPRRGTTDWTQAEVAAFLADLALPADAGLSVLCVEVMPTLAALRHGAVDGTLSANVSVADRLASYRAGGDPSSATQADDGVRPLSDNLGQHRILRTSPLTAVPEVCCTTC